MNPKFNEAKDRLVTSAQRVAGTYLLSKYGSAHLTGEPKVELTATEGPTSSSFIFSGKITCFASDGLLNQVGVNMTVNENDIEVTSEDIQANISEALNAAEDNRDVVVAGLDGFQLTDDGTQYLKVSHLDLNEAKLGVVGKNEYATSKSKVALLQGIVKDAFVDSVVSFTGEFKEPKIEKQAALDDSHECQDCGKKGVQPYTSLCPACIGKSKKEAALVEEIKPKALSWFNDELLKAADLENIDYEPGREVSDTDTVTKIFAVKEDAPLARSADYLVQEAQAEDQSMLEAQLKVEHEAASQLISLLQGMGYGSAKAVEITSSKDGVDVMTAIDDAGTVKAVSIPVTVKEGKVVLPKKALISTLVAKGLDAKAKLMEQFDLEALEKLAAIDEKAAYEIAEAEAILAEQPVTKEAAGEKQPFFDSDDSTMTLQKHLIPNSDKLKKGDRLSDGTDNWEIVNTEGQQNDKNEGSSSLWTLKKVQNPEHDGKEPKNKIPS